MTFSGFDNMTFLTKILFPHQKINGTCGFGTTPADKLKIEIPINSKIPNIETGATHNTDGIINKLVMVFAFPATLTDLYNIIPRPRQCPLIKLVHFDLLPTPNQPCTATRVKLSKLVPGLQKPRRTLLAP